MIFCCWLLRYITNFVILFFFRFHYNYFWRVRNGTSFTVRYWA
jgi:hypothetical protein